MDLQTVALIAGSAGTILAIGVFQYRKRKLLPRFPDILPSSLSGEPLTQHPPNIGGDGHPQYRGPNYLDPVETADYLRPIPHYGGLSPAEVSRGDLSWEYEPGCVAPDGTIWLSPDSRAAFGTVTVPDIEVPKAVRFGWQLDENSRDGGYCEVKREQT